MGNAYLLVYNLALFAGWSYCLYLTYDTVLVKHGGTADVWKVVEWPLKIAQTAALLEVVHAALGVVRSPVAITAMQVASRLWVVWGLVNAAPDATTQGAVTILPQTLELGGVRVPLQLNLITLLTAWCVTEIIRYSFFAVKELGGVPYPLLWLRYSAFLPMYPLGVASELSMAWLAFPAIRKSQLWRFDMPNAINFAFDYSIAIIVIVATYLPGLPTLYSYMLAQRRKVLSGPSKVATADKKTQ